MNSNNVEVILGPEYNDNLFEALSNALKAEGATISHKDWGMAGSQEVSTWDIKIKDETIHVEAETYVGLSIRGPHSLIERIVQRVEDQKIAN